ncbi:helix-turn-helix transcriptional regulator [Jannaschia sp. LMIT008]|uniref:helix-turn-helix domain-containing protein n=1 Tax=Jannaschia maritima TaxID=3032585 RepID=UPI0028112EC6|nr:helix-turn-helix transcriptional regulator [Jannaschia sp. LMIT008]
MPDQAADDDWYDPEATTFGDRLTGAREAAGLTQAELADRLGVSSETVGAWESDRAEPRADRVSRLAGMLNVSLMWLLTGVGEGTVAGTDDASLLEAVIRAHKDAALLSDRLRVLEDRLRERLGVE